MFAGGMRKLVYFVACTADGFIARSDGSFAGCFLFEGEHLGELAERFPETFPAIWRERLGITGEARRFDTVLMGRRTYAVGLREGMKSPYAPLRQIVFSRTLQDPGEPGVMVEPGNALEAVRGLKAEEGLDIWLCGGSELAGTLYTEIDELILKVNPFVIGQGMGLFGQARAARRGELVEHKVFSNGFVLTRYLLSRAGGG